MQWDTTNAVSVVKTGLITTSSANSYFKPKVTVISGSSGVQAFESGPFYVQTTAIFSVSLGSMLTTSASSQNIIEFLITISNAVTKLVFEFPAADDDGNAMWPADITPGTNDDSLFPCAGESLTLSGNQLACTSFAGTSTGATRPSIITVTGFTSTANTQFGIILTGIANPTDPSTFVDIFVRAFSGSTLVSSSCIKAAYMTTSTGAITTAAADTTYAITSDKVALWPSTTFTFKSGVNIGLNQFVQITLPSQCTLSSSPTSSIGTVLSMLTPSSTSLIMKATSALTANSIYTITNIQCQTDVGVTFTMVHSTDGSAGEIRTSDLEKSTSEINSQTVVTPTGTPNFLSNSLFGGQSNVFAKVKIDLSAFASAGLTISAGYELKVIFNKDGFIAPDSLTSCLVYDGLTQANAAQPITCTVTTSGSTANGGIAKIAGFSGLGTLSLEISFGSSSTNDGTADIYLYSSDSKYASDEYTAQMHVSFSISQNSGISQITNSGGALTASGVRPGATPPSNQFTFDIPNAGTTGFTYSSQKLNVIFESTAFTSLAPTDCTLSSTDHYTTCVVDTTNNLLSLEFNATSGDSIPNLPTESITVTTTGTWPILGSKVFITLEINDGSPTYSSDIAYISLSGSYALSTTDIGMLHQTASSVNEFSFQFTPLIDINTRYALAVESTEVTMPTSVQYAEIDCLCYNTVVSTTIPITANCYSDSTNKRITIHPQAAAVSAGNLMECYIPEITNGASTTNFAFSLLDMMNGFALYSSSPTLVISSATSSSGGSATITPNYASTNNKAGSPIVFSLQVTTPVDLDAGASVYVNLNQAGPVLSTCPSGSALRQIRCYTKRKNIVVAVLANSVTTSSNINLFSSTSLAFPSILLSTSYYTVSGFIAKDDASSILATSSTDYSSSFIAGNF